MRLIDLNQVLIGTAVAFTGWLYYDNVQWVVVGLVVATIGILFGPRSGGAGRPFLYHEDVRNHQCTPAYTLRRDGQRGLTAFPVN
jgi:hypothetical protein